MDDGFERIWQTPQKHVYNTMYICIYNIQKHTKDYKSMHKQAKACKSGHHQSKTFNLHNIRNHPAKKKKHPKHEKPRKSQSKTIRAQFEQILKIHEHPPCPYAYIFMHLYLKRSLHAPALSHLPDLHIGKQEQRKLWVVSRSMLHAPNLSL